MMAVARLATLMLACASLSGCVAAAAIPVLAGGSMLRSEAVTGDKPAAPAPRQPVASTPSANPGIVMTDLRALPEPGSGDIAQGMRDRSEARSFDQFYGYALAQASLDPLEAPMRSALLDSPGSLQPVRQHCITGDPLVLVDLDPAGATFDPATPGAASRPLAEVLAVLRARGLGVAWLSDAPEAAADAVRAALRAGRLDPQGSDRLLLADGKTSKQQRRQALAETACPVAVAGDDRADFDELYAYLKNPEAAFELNEMFGSGWFLTPNPFD